MSTVYAHDMYEKDGLQIVIEDLETNRLQYELDEEGIWR